MKNASIFCILVGIVLPRLNISFIITEKLNVSIVDAVSHSGLLTVEEELAVKEAQEKHRDFLTIPRRYTDCTFMISILNRLNISIYRLDMFEPYPYLIIYTKNVII